MAGNITAILVTYNSAGVVEAALRPLLFSSDVALIIVVDNCSTDHTCAMIRRDFPSVILIENTTNEGFGLGNNKALEQVTTPFALLVNPDAVLTSDTISELSAAAVRYADAAIIAPMLEDEKGKRHKSYKRHFFAREKSRDIYIEPEGDLCADFLSGAVWLLNMALIKHVGFFDPAIFLYYEDDDLCLRARAAGYSLVLVARAKAVHLMGKSSGEISFVSESFKQSHLLWSRLYVEQKYKGLKSAKNLALRLKLTCSLRAILYGVLCNRKKLNRYRGRLAGIARFNGVKTIISSSK